MAYWLVKSEPYKYSWEQFVKDKQTFWDGIRSYEARGNLARMRKGDLVFFYHSNKGLEIVGIAKVSAEASPDTTTTEPGWLGVTLKAVKPLTKSLSLQTLKAHKDLSEMALIRRSRLSVSPVRKEEWELILTLSDTKLT